MKLSQIETGGDTMKKIIAFFVCSNVCSACSSNHKFMVGDSIRSINKQHMPYISNNVLSAYKVNENYLIIVADGEIVQKLVEFSSDRKCRRIQGFDLVNKTAI